MENREENNKVKKKKKPDMNEMAFDVVQEMTKEKSESKEEKPNNKE